MTKMTLAKAKSILQLRDMSVPGLAEAFTVVAKDYTRRATVNKETAIATLHREGFLTKAGRPTKRYAPKP